MKVKIVGDILSFFCPGCKNYHSVGISPEHASHWQWNGDEERVTLSPSVLCRSGHYAPNHTPGKPCWCDHNKRNPNNIDFECFQCHSFVRDGNIQFLSDCTHSLAGQTVPIPDYPEV